MRSLRASIRRLFGLIPSSRADRDFDAELESHLQHHIDDNLRAGMSPRKARRAALVAWAASRRPPKRTATGAGCRSRRGWLATCGPASARCCAGPASPPLVEPGR
jgi:hypothetical protein